MKYSKAPLDYCQILSLLKSRGLLIKDKDIAQLKGCTPYECAEVGGVSFYTGLVGAAHLQDLPITLV